MTDRDSTRVRGSSTSGADTSPRADAVAKPAMVKPARVLDWLRQALHDLRLCHVRSLLFGLCFALMGQGLASAHAENPMTLLVLVAGFLLIGPIVAAGLYELSRQVQRRESPDLLMALFCWARNPQQLFMVAFLCVFMLIVLSLATRSLLGTPLSSSIPESLLSRWSEDSTGRLAAVGWIAVWVLLASIVFLSSAVAVPLLVDRPVSVFRAVAFSARCSARNPLTFLLWALIVWVLVGGSLLLDGWPLLLAGPLTGHATWHAYRSCIER